MPLNRLVQRWDSSGLLFVQYIFAKTLHHWEVSEAELTGRTDHLQKVMQAEQKTVSGTGNQNSVRLGLGYRQK